MRNRYIDLTYRLTKKFLHEKYPEYEDLFDATWDIQKESLMRMMEDGINQYEFVESPQKLMGDLGLIGSSYDIDAKFVDKLSYLIGSTIYGLSALENQATKEDTIKTLREYAQKCSIPTHVLKSLLDSFPTIIKNIHKELDVGENPFAVTIIQEINKKIKRDTKYCDEKNIETYNLLNGEYKVYINIPKNEYFIKTGDGYENFVLEKKQLSILIYLLKKAGLVCTYNEIYDKFWRPSDFRGAMNILRRQI